MGWDGIYCGYWCRHRSKDRNKHSNRWCRSDSISFSKPTNPLFNYQSNLIHLNRKNHMKGLMGLQNIPQPLAVTWFAKYPLASFEVTYWKWDDFESNFLAHFSPAPIHPHSPCKMFHRNSLVLRNSARFHFWNSLKREKAIKKTKEVGGGWKSEGRENGSNIKRKLSFSLGASFGWQQWIMETKKCQDTADWQQVSQVSEMQFPALRFQRHPSQNSFCIF